MENHPIPQDITGFKFKLIGKMTVRQFAYLATGMIIAWIFYILPFPFIIRLPFIILFSSLGAALAFVPIGGRPMDTMIMNFIKALLAPTQYVYQKQGGNLAETQAISQTQPQQPIPVLTQTTPPPTVINLPAPAAPAVQAPIVQTPPPLPLLNLDEEKPTSGSQVDPVVSPQVSPQPPEGLSTDQEQKIAEDEKKTEEEVEVLRKDLEEAKRLELQTAPAEQPVVHQKTEELEKMLEQTIRQKEELEKELLILKSKLESQKQEALAPPIQEAPPIAPAAPIAQSAQALDSTPTPQPPAKEKAIPGLPQEPNLITGVIKDPRGNILQNILVEVKDQEDNPVRAFKTNNLGKFASATSLSNGKYSITFEDSDGKNKFDAVEIEATGAPIMPLDVVSVDPREELRRELFN